MTDISSISSQKRRKYLTSKLWNRHHFTVAWTVYTPYKNCRSEWSHREYSITLLLWPDTTLYITVLFYIIQKFITSDRKDIYLQDLKQAPEINIQSWKFNKCMQYITSIMGRLH